MKFLTVTSSTTVSTVPARVVAVLLNPGSGDATITLKNSSSGNSGTAHLGTLGTPANQSAEWPGFSYPFSLGIYALFSPGFGGSATIFYEPI